MNLISRKIAAFAKKVANLPPKPGGTMPVADLQAQFDAAPEELRAALNGAIDDIIADYATKAELSGIQLGQITDGTITPPKMSKGVTSAPTADTYTLRDAAGRTQFSSPSASADAATKGYVDAIKPASGMYTGDGAASRDIALPFTPTAVFVYPKTGFPITSSTPNSGLAVTGSPVVNSTGLAAVTIGTNKFTVASGAGSNDARTNTNGEKYHYIAFP